MARRRLTPAQPGYQGSAPAAPRATAPPIAQVAGQSAEAAALREVTAGLQAARDEGRMVIDMPLEQIAPGYLARDRLALDPEALEALKASIAAHGQRQPAEVTPLPGMTGPQSFGLISGWRRLQALRALHGETQDPRFASLRVLIRPPEEAGASYVAMVEENEIRVGLSYYERARVVFEATARGVFADHTAALRTLFATASRAKRSKIASFIEIHEALGDLLTHPAEIPERLGLALVGALREGGKGRIRGALKRAAPESAATELALLHQLIRPAPARVSRAKQAEALRPDLTLQITRQGRAITATLSGEGLSEALLERVRAALRETP